MQKQLAGAAAILVFSLILCTLPPTKAGAEEGIEKAGVGIGVSIGNLFFLPAKAASVTMGLISSSVALIVTGGNTDLSAQILHDTTAGPYVITPELAGKAAGKRPELEP